MDLRMQHLVRAGGLEVFDLDATLARLGGERMVLQRVLHQFALDLAEWEPSLMALRGLRGLRMLPPCASWRTPSRAPPPVR